MNAKELACIVREALRRCHAAGIRIHGLTCDGPRGTVNVSMLNELGKRIKIFLPRCKQLKNLNM